MFPYRVDAPASPLVPYADLRTRLNIILTGDATEDAARQNDVESLEAAAVDYLDGYSGRLGRCILAQKWAFPLDVGTEVVYLPFPDCHSFAVEAKDEFGDLQPVADVEITEGRGCVSLSGLGSDVTGAYLTLTAGWATADDVPANITQAIKMLVAFWYDNASAVSDDSAPKSVPLGFEDMIRPLRSLTV